MAKKTTKRATKKPTAPKTYDGPILVLKTTKAGGEPHCNGSDGADGKKINTAFLWPRGGSVTCEDWDPTPRCGHGFHGLEFGEGDWSLLNDVETPSDEWRVLRVQPGDLVRLTDNGQNKVKFRTGEIVYSGDKAGAMVYVMCGQEAMARAAIFAEKKSGDYSRSAISGDYSRSAISGDYSRSAISGDYSRSAISGNYSSSASSGNYSSSASSGNYSSSAISGYYSSSAISGYLSSSASCGDYSSSASSGEYSRSASSGNSSRSASSGNYSSSASSGYYSSSASSGDYSRSASCGDYSSSASCGDYSSSASSGEYSSSASCGNYSSSEQVGKCGIAAAIGDNARGKAGENGLLILTWWDDSDKRYRACVGEVGIDGIEADTWYEVKGGKLSKATS
jgi:hypothetical protein